MRLQRMRQSWESRKIREADVVQHVTSDPCQAFVKTAGIVSTFVLAWPFFFFLSCGFSSSPGEVMRIIRLSPASLDLVLFKEEPAFSFLVSWGESDLKSGHSFCKISIKLTSKFERMAASVKGFQQHVLLYFFFRYLLYWLPNLIVYSVYSNLRYVHFVLSLSFCFLFKILIFIREVL